MYAGVDGNKVTQGNPPAIKWSPRVGVVYSMNTKTVVRGGYGIFWAPWNSPAPSPATSNYGQVGFTQNTLVPQNVTGSDGEPYQPVSEPGWCSRSATLLGRQPEWGRTSRTPIRTALRHACSSSPWTSSGSCRPTSRSSSATWVRAAINLGLGGSNDAVININQLDPKYLALGAALNQTGGESVLRRSRGRPFATQATLSRAQLLRPYPQFVNVNAGHVTEGKNRYNAMVVEWSRRMSKGFGARVSYTYSN